MGWCGYAYGDGGGVDYQGCGWCVTGNIVGGLVVGTSGEREGQKMIFGNAGHFKTLVKITGFFFFLLRFFKYGARDCNYFYSTAVAEK